MTDAYEQVPLGKLVSMVSKWKPADEAPDEFFDYVDLSSINKETKTIEEPARVIGREAPSRARQVLSAGDVLVSTVRPNLNGVAYVGDAYAGATASTGFCVLRPRPKKLHARYLYHWVQTTVFVDSLVKQATGASYPAVNNTIVKRETIPLPSLDEQRHIATILDRADALRAKRRRAQAMLGRIEQSVFREMFGNPFGNPKGWPERTLKEASVVFSDGPFGSKLKSSHYVEQGVRVVRLQNIGVGEFVDEDQAFVSQEHFDSLGKHCCVPGDVVVGTLGDPNLRACILPDTIPQALNKADCVQIRPDPEVVTSGYLCWLLNMPGTVQKASLLAHGQTRSRISMGQLRKLELPIPPLDLQKAFDERLEAVAKLKHRVMASQQQLEDLYLALAQRAFRGELTEPEVVV